LKVYFRRPPDWSTSGSVRVAVPSA